MRLLLIEDDEIDHVMVERLLRVSDDHLDVVHASTAVEGIDLFDASHFDLVLLDYLLPDMDGLEVLKRLLSHPRHNAAVVILTGGVDEALEMRCIEAGAQDLLLKREISAPRLRRALLHARARHQLEAKLLESREALRILAENDPLTGVANRYFFDQYLRAAIGHTQRGGDKLALLLLDVDNFKMINDGMGHDAGDEVLHGVAQRLREVARESDTVCRLGGDEFAIIAPNIDNDIAIANLANRIGATLKTPFRVSGCDVVVSSSIGIALAPDSGATAEQLLKSADLAMYQAKRGGKGRFSFYSAELQREATRKIEIERDLRSPNILDQFELYYQPLVNARSFEVRGAEALIRWNHPTRGLLPPSEFLDAAEEFGLITVIDAWSRQAACRQMVSWIKHGLVSDHFHLTFNISAASLRVPDLDLEIARESEALGVPKGRMHLEVTENVLVSDFTKSAAMLNQIKSDGMDISVDDFGTGYSSMAYLKRLPASTLKIDRAFLHDVPDSEADCRILRAMITMALSLDLSVIVEGVETLGQAEACRRYGAHMLQGYYFSRPLPARSFETHRLGLCAAN